MKPPITLPLPKCKKCNKTLEPRFTTEKEEGDNSKPEVLMLYGACEDCKAITMCNIIKTEDLPNEKKFMQFANQKETAEVKDGS